MMRARPAMFLALLASACHPDGAPPSSVDAGAPGDKGGPSWRDAVPEVFPGVTCTMIGCLSGVYVVAHVAASPAELAAGGSFHACHRGYCWEGTFGAPPAPGTLAGCEVHAPKEGMRCLVGAEGSGSTVEMQMAAPEASKAGWRGFADGDRVTIRIDVGDARLVEESRAVEYVDRYPNGRLCKPHCRTAKVELASSSVPAKPGE